MRAARRGLLALGLALPAIGRAAAATRFIPGDGPRRGPAAAPGAIVWLHGGYREGEPPEPPVFLRHLAASGWDLFRQLRPPFTQADPLAPAGAELATATAGLRRDGYRQVALVGESRGAFVGLVALAAPRLADSALFIAPAAHGPRPERRAQAMQDFAAALGGMAPDALRRAGIVQFRDDPYDPDPAARRDLFLAALRARGVPGFALFHPAAPDGHGGMNDPGFDPLFGACLCRFLDLGAPAEAYG